jgi:hypothetical protein
MGNPAQHGKLGFRSEPESLPHPREEMGKTVMSTFYSLGNPCTAARKGQCSGAVRTQNDVGIHIR